MTVYQEAHSMIDQFPEETVCLFIQLMEKIAPAPAKKDMKKKSSFLASAGTIDIDENVIKQFREASMI